MVRVSAKRPFWCAQEGGILQLTRLVVPVVLLLSACATVQVGREFDLSAFQARVQRGVTTRDEVRTWLGAPTGVGTAVETSGDRYEEWTYYRGAGELPDMKDAQMKMLQIKFDQGGIVRAYSWTSDRR